MVDPLRKRPVVFLHGWTMEGRIFANIIDRLDGAFDCHAPTLPGHGGAGGEYPLTIDGAADFVVDYIGRHDLPHPVLVGWSLGAMVAWNLARRYPQLPLAGIVVIDMSPKIVNDAAWHLGIRGFDCRHNERTLAAMKADWAGYAERVDLGMHATGNSADHPDILSIIRQKDACAMAAIWTSLSQADERRSLGRIACPMLVIKGAKSRIYPMQTGRYIADNVPDAKLVRMANSGHSPHLEEPGQFADILADWIRDISTA